VASDRLRGGRASTAGRTRPPKISTRGKNIHKDDGKKVLGKGGRGPEKKPACIPGRKGTQGEPVTGRARLRM